MEYNLKRSTLSLAGKTHPATRTERWAWYLYDFGNSAYAAVVLLAVYSTYFKQQVVGGAEGSRLWGLSIGIAMLVVAIFSPVLGALADISASKKRLLFLFTALACIFTAMLFLVGPGDIWQGMVFFILAEIGYRGAQVFYNALLPEIAEPKDIGRVSGNGWAIGSIGGIVCLGIVLALILTVGGEFVTRVAFLITAVFYALCTLPIFFLLRERTVPQVTMTGKGLFSASLRKAWQTFQRSRDFRPFIKFLAAFLVFNNGIMMTLDFAAIIGAVLFGLTQQQLIIFMIIVQITSVAGAFFFGRIASSLGAKTAILLSLGLMIVTIISLFYVDSLVVFNLIGALAGFSLTGVQSVSRAAIGELAPREKSAEFFGLFSMAGQISAFTGPAIYGFLATSLALMLERGGMPDHPAEVRGMRLALFAILAFLLCGGLLLASMRSWRKEASHE